MKKSVNLIVLIISFFSIWSSNIMALDRNNLVQVESVLQTNGHKYGYLTTHNFADKKTQLDLTSTTPPPPTLPTSTPAATSTGAAYSDSLNNLVTIEKTLKTNGSLYQDIIRLDLENKIAISTIIPIPEVIAGADTPVATPLSATINLSFGFNENKGRHRPSMEDAHEMTINSPDSGFFGVYDGHGGAQVAFYLAKHLYQNIKTQPNFGTDPIQAIIDGSEKTNSNLRLSTELGEAYKDKAKTNNLLQMKDIASGTGSTATFAIVEGDQLYVGNAGDARTVISTNGIAKALSVDHKPDRPDEKKRVEDLGGKVIEYGVWRVADPTWNQYLHPWSWKSSPLAISRAFGDFNLSPYVIATPEVQHHTITPADDFLILACDGVWDVFSDQQAVDLVRTKLAEHPEDLNLVAKALVDGALAAGSRDNVSVIIVKFK